MTSQAGANNLDAQVLSIDLNPRDETAITVNILPGHDHIPIERKHPRKIPGLLRERLASLRRVNPIDSDADRSLRLRLQDVNGVAIDDADNVTFEGLSNEIRRALGEVGRR